MSETEDERRYAFAEKASATERRLKTEDSRLRSIFVKVHPSGGSDISEAKYPGGQLSPTLALLALSNIASRQRRQQCVEGSPTLELLTIKK